MGKKRDYKVGDLVFHPLSPHFPGIVTNVGYGGAKCIWNTDGQYPNIGWSYHKFEELRGVKEKLKKWTRDHAWAEYNASRGEGVVV